jgi:hypothetical protein
MTETIEPPSTGMPSKPIRARLAHRIRTRHLPDSRRPRKPLYGLLMPFLTHPQKPFDYADVVSPPADRACHQCQQAVLAMPSTAFRSGSSAFWYHVFQDDCHVNLLLLFTAHMVPTQSLRLSRLHDTAAPPDIELIQTRKCAGGKGSRSAGQKRSASVSECRTPFNYGFTFDAPIRIKKLYQGRLYQRKATAKSP